MPKQRILLMAVFFVVVVGVFLLLPAPKEPKYEGRYLSEWMAAIAYSNLTSSDLTEAEQAVKNIGTNAVPFFVDWFTYASSDRMSPSAVGPSKIDSAREDILQWLSPRLTPCTSP